MQWVGRKIREFADKGETNDDVRVREAFGLLFAFVVFGWTLGMLVGIPIFGVRTIIMSTVTIIMGLIAIGALGALVVWMYAAVLKGLEPLVKKSD